MSNPRIGRAPVERKLVLDSPESIARTATRLAREAARGERDPERTAKVIAALAELCRVVAAAEGR